MRIAQTRIRNFRNLESALCEWHPGLNILTGPNGAGKTNVLEALHVLTGWGAFSGSKCADTVRWESEGGASLAAQVEGEHSAVVEAAIVARASLRLDGRACRWGDLRSCVQSLAFLPADMALIEGSPAVRRRFLDVLCALADRALALAYVRPKIDESGEIDIRGGRHPIVEQLPGSERFVPNDARLGGPGRQIMVITGPNMAGKSTYIRQVALLVVMAQIGSFVPADEARIGLVDRVFTRVGASDDLARGRSTFLVEMQETANILNNATARSLVVLDEIGRGTSTFDGISIAWAVAEYLHDTPEVKAKTLFATHYHELTDLSLTLRDVVNCSVLVRERGDGIVFLRRIVEGPADKSYGIAVAKLAGMPEPVLRRARQILSNLEKDEIAEDGRPAIVSPRGAGPKVRKPDDNRQLLLGL